MPIFYGTKTYEAFVYIWYHGPTKRYYIGSHKGDIDDGYSHSSSIIPTFDANDPPPGWRRRIIAYGTRKEMYDKEVEYLAQRRKRGWFRSKYINRALGREKSIDRDAVINLLKSGVSMRKTADRLGIGLTSVQRIKKEFPEAVPPSYDDLLRRLRELEGL